MNHINPLLSSQQLANLRAKTNGKLYENYRLAPITAWHAGGAAQYLYHPANLNDLITFLKELPSDIPITWLGATTNVLIRDGGIRGVVIYVRGKLNEIHDVEIKNDPNSIVIYTEAGTSCSKLIQHTARLGIFELAFLAGIPGTVGGALAMNAGAYGGEIWQHVLGVTTINRYGIIKERIGAEFKAGYREVTGLGENEWFVACNLHCVKGNVQQTLARIKELVAKRRATQPLGTFNCGSVFRNPPGNYAARLIEECGLKGARIGGAVVSEKHANFIINEGTATAADIENLIKHVATTVERMRGIKLVSEVKILGE